MATWLYVLRSLSFWTESGGCRSGKWGTVTRSEQRMRLLSGGIALWLRRHQLSEELLSSYNAIFGAAEMEVDDGHLAVCIAVSKFFETKNSETAIQVVMSVCMAGVELCDIPTCLMEVAKCLLCQGFQILNILDCWFSEACGL